MKGVSQLRKQTANQLRGANCPTVQNGDHKFTFHWCLCGNRRQVYKITNPIQYPNTRSITLFKSFSLL